MIEQKKTGGSGRPFRFNELWIYAIILAILGGLFLWDGGFGENKDMSWNEFRQMMNQGAFTQITVDRGEKTATAQLNKRAADSLFTHRSPVLGREQKRIEYTVKTQIPTVDRFAEAYDTSGTTAKVAYKEESSPLDLSHGQYRPLHHHRPLLDLHLPPLIGWRRWRCRRWYLQYQQEQGSAV